MAEICPVCEKEVHPSYKDEIEGVVLHSTCFNAFMENKDIFKKKYFELKEENELLSKSDEEITEVKLDEEIPEVNLTALQYLAGYYSNIVSFLAVLTAIIGVLIALVAIFTGEILIFFFVLLGTPLVVISLFGFIAIIIEMYRHLKSIDNKLSGMERNKNGWNLYSL